MIFECSGDNHICDSDGTFLSLCVGGLDRRSLCQMANYSRVIRFVQKQVDCVYDSILYVRHISDMIQSDFLALWVDQCCVIEAKIDRLKIDSILLDACDVFSFYEYIIWDHSCKLSWFMDIAFNRWVCASIVVNKDWSHMCAYKIARCLSISSFVDYIIYHHAGIMRWFMDDCSRVMLRHRLRRVNLVLTPMKTDQSHSIQSLEHVAVSYRSSLWQLTNCVWQCRPMFGLSRFIRAQEEDKQVERVVVKS